MTLIELIMVLALLAVVVALAAPSLSPFFRGRALEEEARRLLALTRYARSEAVSRCVPMEVWIDCETSEYGVAAQAGYAFEDTKEPIQFRLDKNLSFVVDQQDLDETLTARIVYQPDGAMDDENPEKLVIQDSARGEALGIVRTENGLAYEIVREWASGEQWVLSNQQ